MAALCVKNAADEEQRKNELDVRRQEDLAKKDSNDQAAPIKAEDATRVEKLREEELNKANELRAHARAET